MTLDAFAQLLSKTEFTRMRLFTSTGLIYDVMAPEQIVTMETVPEQIINGQATTSNGDDFEELIEFITFAKKQVARRAAR